MRFLITAAIVRFSRNAVIFFCLYYVFACVWKSEMFFWAVLNHFRALHHSSINNLVIVNWIISSRLCLTCEFAVSLKWNLFVERNLHFFLLRKVRNLKIFNIFFFMRFLLQTHPVIVFNETSTSSDWSQLDIIWSLTYVCAENIAIRHTHTTKNKKKKHARKVCCEVRAAM